jgi:hypothetical protein
MWPGSVTLVRVQRPPLEPQVVGRSAGHVVRGLDDVSVILADATPSAPATARTVALAVPLVVVVSVNGHRPSSPGPHDPHPQGTRYRAVARRRTHSPGARPVSLTRRRSRYPPARYLPDIVTPSRLTLGQPAISVGLGDGDGWAEPGDGFGVTDGGLATGGGDSVGTSGAAGVAAGGTSVTVGSGFVASAPHPATETARRMTRMVRMASAQLPRTPAV